ncbi:MAG: hypothetical protein ACR2GU_07110 [Rubrobacteraceae bacterium]
MRKIVSRILEILGLAGIPGDLKLWWNVVIPAIPTVLTALILFIEEAGGWAIALVAIGTFVALFLVSIPAQRWVSRKTQEGTQLQQEEPHAQSVGIDIQGKIDNLKYTNNRTTGYEVGQKIGGEIGSAEVEGNESDNNSDVSENESDDDPSTP